MVTGTEALACAVAPERVPSLTAAIVDGGGQLVEPGDAEALVWTDPVDAGALAELLERAPGVRWVQLPFAGVDRFQELLGDGRRWTSAKGAYAEPVAEHALALGLAGLRALPARARAREWGPEAGKRLMGARVTIVGGGGITRALLSLLSPFQVDATVVRRHVAAVPGARQVVGPAQLHEALPGASLVVLTLALTPETAGIVGAEELDRMDGDAWLVNVARGAHVDTDALVSALEQRVIGGAALDVTEPEPLPAPHPLWRLDNCLITPHVANTTEMAAPLLAERVRQNVDRYGRGQELVGLVDPALGY
ncbi:MAG TPA: D-isomer specific 2-hydroxyacid dehydrogenase family protein [Acidimicrobiales bacterium]|nr:D-isomer specific 2-hydroxyacid dehydrogenase family protein [Acidimicrobiales bacterium]